MQVWHVKVQRLAVVVTVSNCGNEASRTRSLCQLRGARPNRSALRRKHSLQRQELFTFGDCRQRHSLPYENRIQAFPRNKNCRQFDKDPTPKQGTSGKLLWLIDASPFRLNSTGNYSDSIPREGNQALSKRVNVFAIENVCNLIVVRFAIQTSNTHT